MAGQTDRGGFRALDPRGEKYRVERRHVNQFLFAIRPRAAEIQVALAPGMRVVSKRVLAVRRIPFPDFRRLRRTATCGRCRETSRSSGARPTHRPLSSNRNGLLVP